MELKKPFLFFWKYNQQENSKSSFMKAIYIYVALISMSLFLVSLLWTLHDYKLSKEQYLQSSAADFEKAISIAFANHYEKGNESIDDYQQFSSLDDYTIAIFENGGLLLSTANFPSTKELENAYSHFEKMSPQLSHQKIELQKGAYLYLMIPDGSYECIQFIPANEYDWFGLSAPSFIYGLLVTLGVAILSVFFFSRYICLPFWRLNEFILNLAADKKDINRGEMEMYISLAEEIGIMPESMSVLFSRDFNSRLLLKQAELDALQSQINPHFLYNTLDTIRGLALSKHDMDIAKMTKALASFFRYSVSMTNPLATVNEEIQNVKNYFIILQYRFDDRFSLEFDFKDDEEAILKTRIPKFTLQPIVENGIKHGLESQICERDHYNRRIHCRQKCGDRGKR